MQKILLIYSLALLMGCNYSISKNLGASSTNQSIEKIPTGTIPEYQTIASGIIAPKCLECHSGGNGNAGGINLETYATVNGNLASIRDEITSGRMPKNRNPLSIKEKEVLLAWIDAGGPLESNTPKTKTETMPDPDQIDYQVVRTQVIGLRCLSCHSVEGKNKGGVNLETYKNVFDQRFAIEDEVRSGSMPRPRTRPLTAIQKSIFLLWLENGAPENVPNNN